MDIRSLTQIASASDLASDHLRALWYDLRGDWDSAHRIVQKMADVNAMWIHAYLHRKEPDLSNSRYWYQRASKPFPESQGYVEEAAVILANLD